MIDELHIRGLGVIEEASLRLAPGLTVVTGETGAGKTMVVTALEQLLGARADSSLVRSGAEAAYAEARISPPPPTAAEWVDGDDELVVSREIPADGRSRARINGRLAPVSALAEAVGAAVEVHGQHEHVSLARPDVQRRLVDRYAGEEHLALVDEHRAAYAAWHAAVEEREQVRADARERARTIDRLRFELEEIEGAGLDPERDARIDDELAELGHVEELQLATGQAASALGDEGVGDPLGVAIDALRRLPVESARLDELRSRLMVVAEEVADLAGELRDYGEQLDADPARLEELRERRMLLVTLQRKYGEGIDEVMAYARSAGEELADLEGREAAAGTLDARIAELDDRATTLARSVTEGRRKAGDALAAAVNDHLADLGMPHATFSVSVEEGSRGPDGGDRLGFLLAANPGEPARSVAHAASGGERSRVALAIEVAVADVNDARVLVFDEVDAGIGGATAMAVGAKLAALAHGRGAANRQVLCVTHLAQLAAFADVHHVVEKSLVGERTVTRTRQVGDDDRVAELARMLGGDATSEAGLSHARELLEAAAGHRGGA